jgi:hypothetical protein
MCVRVCFWKQTTKSKKSYMLMKSKFYVMCKFICDEPFFMKLDMTFVYRRACKILVQRWGKKSQHILLWNLCSFADKTYYGITIIRPIHNWIIKLNMLTKNWKQCNILTYYSLIWRHNYYLKLQYILHAIWYIIIQG